MKKVIYFVFPFVITLLLIFINGCGGTTTSGTNVDNIKLIEQIEDPTKPSSISGSVASITNSVIDFPAGSLVEMVNQANPTIKYSTRTSTRGGYQITDIQPGKYDIYAYIPDKTNPILTGKLKNVILKGNIHSSMINILIGKPMDMGIIQGQVLRNGLPVPGASVTLDLTIYGIIHLEDPTNKDGIMYLTTTYTDDAGQYRFEFPVGSQDIYLAAHSNSSKVSPSINGIRITTFAAGAVVNQDIELATADLPVFPILEYDIFSTTLEKATIENVQAALAFTRANAEKTRSIRMANIADRMMKRLKRNITATSFVENDVFWTVQNTDIGTLGFDVYRGDTLIGDYQKVGNCDDPFMTYYFDSDPALVSKAITYYRVRSYGANNKYSPISSSVVSASPLPAFTDLLPANNAIVKKDVLNGYKISWPRIAGAKSYMIAVYSQEPISNAIPPTFIRKDDNGEPIQECNLTGEYGDYWWIIAAYDKPQLETTSSFAGSFSTYRKLTLTP